MDPNQPSNGHERRDSQEQDETMEESTHEESDQARIERLTAAAIAQMKSLAQDDNNETPTSFPTTSAVTNSISTHDLSGLNMTPAQFQQVTAAQAQALAQAAAAAMAATSTATSSTAAIANSDTNGLFHINTSSAPSASTNSEPMSGVVLNDGNSIPSVSQLTAEMLKRELINQKVRADNRERKKRWRALNEERNKDNDLRCRVNKRANKLFGKEDTDTKRRWVEEEFMKRKQKRKDKERRKHVMDGAIGGLSASSETGTPTSAASSTAGTVAGVNGLQGLAQFNNSPVQPLLPDMNHLAILCQHLGMLSQSSSAGSSAARLLGVKTEGESERSGEEQLSNPLIDFLQQLQQQTQQHQQQQQQQQEEDGDGVKKEEGQEDQKEKGSSGDCAQTAEESSSENKESTGERPEDKLAALLSSTIGTSALTAQREGESSGERTSEQGQGNGQNNVDFPMDAVLTLMQLNAGWRQ